MAVRVFLKVDLLKKIVNRQLQYKANGIPSEYDQWVESWTRGGHTDIDLTNITYELEPLVRVEVKEE